MKFGEIFRFEFRYQWRHVSTWLLFAVFLLFGFMILRMVTLTDETHLNAPGTTAFFTIFGSTILLVMGGVVAGDAATRDRHTRMHLLTYTTPVSKFNYLGARFLAALVLNGLILLTLYAGFLLSFYGPGAKTQWSCNSTLEIFLRQTLEQWKKNGLTTFFWTKSKEKAPFKGTA